MKVASAPSRPITRYYGGKFKLAPWIISHFPPHQSYVEPCGGGASVLLQKKRSPLEIYNDIYAEVVNFFKVLRDQPADLVRQVTLTPWARDEYELSKLPCTDNLEKARRFFMGNILSISGNPKSSGFRVMKDAKNAGDRIASVIDQMEITAARLTSTPKSMIQIENDTYERIIDRFDGSKTLFYFDPPYVHSERSSVKEYEFEWTDGDHKKSAELLNQVRGCVVVSGYACPLYADLYEAHGWDRIDKKAQTNSGGERIESLWLSPRTTKALNRPVQTGLF